MRHDFHLDGTMPLVPFVWGFLVFPDRSRRRYAALKLYHFFTADGRLHYGRIFWASPFWLRLDIRSAPRPR